MVAAVLGLGSKRLVEPPLSQDKPLRHQIFNSLEQVGVRHRPARGAA
jgi:hypothetical protein